MAFVAMASVENRTDVAITTFLIDARLSQMKVVPYPRGSTFTVVVAGVTLPREDLIGKHIEGCRGEGKGNAADDQRDSRGTRHGHLLLVRGCHFQYNILRVPHKPDLPGPP